MTVKFSIVIPCKESTPYLEECLKHIKRMSFKDYEVIVLPDNKESIPGVRVIMLNAGPAEKRDLGVSEARGEFIAFIDDDAFPDRHWLSNSLKYFKKGYAAVGGPQITPKTDSFSQKVSGFTLSSRMVGGLRARYESVDSSFEINDWPTVNFLVKKSVFEEVGGFDNSFYPGEDTKLCLDIVNAGHKMVYAPDVVVYHHRRQGLSAHLKQISNYGFHRGYFVKEFPETSFKLNYFFPSTFLMFFLTGIFSFFFSGFVFNIFLVLMVFYFLFAFIEGIRLSKNLSYSLVLPFFVFFTHLFYGAKFIKGLFSKEVLR